MLSIIIRPMPASRGGNDADASEGSGIGTGVDSGAVEGVGADIGGSAGSVLGAGVTEGDWSCVEEGAGSEDGTVVHPTIKAITKTTVTKKQTFIVISVPASLFQEQLWAKMGSLKPVIIVRPDVSYHVSLLRPDA